MERKFIDNYGEKIINFYEKVQWPQNPHHCNTYIRVVASAVYGENASVLSVNIGKVYFMGVFVP